MPTLSELGQVLIASRVVSVERWQNAAKLGANNLARTLDALTSEPPEWWHANDDEEAPPGLTEYQRGVIDLWMEGNDTDLSRLLIRNQFVLLEKLGEGGQGEVYRARQLNPGRFVAVKTLTQDSEVRRQRFEQEARAMMKIQHAGVARFYLYERVRDLAGKPTDEYLIAMEYVDGNDLSRMIHSLGPLPWPFVVRWAINLLEGLAVIHHNGFIHRDVKPANVMVLGPLPEAGASPNGTKAKLLDFGAVKQAVETGTVGRKRIFIGTREYAAPEQWDERPVPASDVYALGATLFNALTGRVPYEIEDRDAIALMKAHTLSPIPDVKDFTRDVPDELNQLIRQMLSKNPDYRGTATEVAQAFRELIPASEKRLAEQQTKNQRKKPPKAKPVAAVQARPLREPAPNREPQNPVHTVTEPILSFLERLFLPRNLRPPAGHEPPLPERVAVLLRRPLLLLTIVVFIALLVWLLI